MSAQKTNTDRAPQDLFVEVDGIRVHYQQAGFGRPFLLIHGLVGSARNWRRNIADLSREATVYAIDLPNMGESGRVPGLDAGLEATADRLARWMDVVGLDQADIAGHSHGGSIAIMLAARHPHRVGKLVLFAPANPFCDLGRQLVDFYSSRPGHWIARLIPALPTFIKATALGRMYGDPARVTSEALEGYTAGLAIPGSVGHVLRIVSRWHTDMTLLCSSLSRLGSRQVLLLWGDRDRAVSLASAHKLQQVFSQSRLVVIPGAGHIAFEEMPAECNEAMCNWLSAADEASAPSFNLRHSAEPLRHLKAV